MTIVKRSAVVFYSPAEMFELVDRIEDYPVFLPWCKSSEILSRSPDEVQATLVLAKGGMEKAFTTCNRLQKDKMIEIRLLNGPFRHLEGFWRFTPVVEGGCEVVLDLEFEFSSKIISMMFGSVFQQVVHTLVEAFCKRAEQIYGTPGNDSAIAK
jgi:ribosome-associated toxin RatA of RatAB toxin-antitoxin module